MDVDREKVYFTEAEQKLANLPSSAPVTDIGALSEQVFDLLNRFDSQITGLMGSADRSTQELLHSLIWRQGDLAVLDRLLLEAGAPYVADEASQYLDGQATA